MKKKIMISTLVLLLAAASVVSAHPGRTDSRGGHTCRTNCERWGLAYGEYHYHNGGGSSAGSKSSSSKSASKSTAKPKEQRPAVQTYVKSGLKVFINGNQLRFGSEPLIYNNTNLVPLREIAEGMGAAVTWNKEAGAIGVQKGNRKMTLTIGSRTVYYNGKPETAAAAPKVIDGVTYVPVQVFARGLGANITYSAQKGTLHISY